MVVIKGDLEYQLKNEHQLIQDGVIRDDNPLDNSEEFQKLCQACRVGDLKGCQEAIMAGININASDIFNYTPLILASLCGHYEVVRLLLEAGALCERDTFQGERCLYNALNDRIRDLLLEYDYSKNTDPLQPLASHITSLLTRKTANGSDICLTNSSESWDLHKFVLSARSPYFRKKLTGVTDTTILRLPSTIPSEAFDIALRYLYLGDVPADLGLSKQSLVTEEEVLTGIDKLSKQLEIESLWEGILSGNDRRIARQRHQDEVERGRNQIEDWFHSNVLKHKIRIETSKAQDVKWTHDNNIFADVLIQADEYEDIDDLSAGQQTPKVRDTPGPLNGIPVGPSATLPTAPVSRKQKYSVLFPAHRAMLLRSEYFQTMFESSFKEAKTKDYLQIINIDCAPEVLEIVVNFLYTEKADMPLEYAIDVLYAADMLFIEKLKNKAAVVVSTMGNGVGSLADRTHTDAEAEEGELVNPYDVLRAAWTTRVQRLEEFSARYLAYRLEDYIDEQEFEQLVKESASRIENRQETDSIELIDEIRYFLSERFRLRFEDVFIDELEEELEAGAVDTGPENGIQVDDTTSATNGNAVESAPLSSTTGEIRTLDGNLAGDEFAADAINYQVLLEKIDALLDKLKLDA